jgi:hypothetical protein
MAFNPKTRDQSDQIGRIFAHWVIVSYRQFLKIVKVAHFWSNFSRSLDYAIILTKNRFGYILGDFFTNSSGHPARDQLSDNFFSNPKLSFECRGM